jgi:tetratricopeptide (TPR) repeat protein
VSKRHKLIWKTLILCSFPVLVVAAGIVLWQKSSDAPYVAGAEEEGITRSLDRGLDEPLSGLRFSEVTEQAGIRFEHFPFQRTSQLPEDMGSGGAWGDYDGDGLPDLFLVNFAAPVGVPDAQMAASAATDRLFRNRGDGTFEDVTASTGVGRAHRGMGASFADYDADGDVDLFVTSWGENILWENQGEGKFRDVTSAAGLEGDGFWTGAAWADFDQDGDLDLYVCGYVQYIPEEPGASVGEGEFPFTLNPSSFAPHPNRFYVNRGDGTFEERAVAAGIQGVKGRSLAAAWVDFDVNGLPDLYVTNDVSDNTLYENQGDGTFRNISYEALVADYRGSMGIAIGDWDGDLDLDLFITHWIAQENALYTNLTSEFAADESGARVQFSDDADRVGLGQIALDLIGWGTAFVDLDNDGLLDLFVANGSTFQQRDDPSQLVPMDPHLYWNRGPEEGFFEVGEAAGIRTRPPGSGRGVAFADYDADGDLDLLIVRHAGRARLLRNDSRTGHWIGFRIRAKSGHASGRGARIVLRADGRDQVREVGAGASYLSQSDSDVLIGLGMATRVESVEIQWPGGSLERWQDLEVDRMWNLEEGREPQPLESKRKQTIARRVSDVSEHALVSDLSSQLTPEQKSQFWKLNASAQRLFVEGRWEDADRVYAEMIEIDPLHEDARYYRGNCLLELERFAAAVENWRRLIELNPSSSRAWVQIGIVHALPEAGGLYDLDSASAAFEAAHRINREESRPLALLGEVAVAQGALDTAHGALESAYRMNPRSTSALYLSGYIAWKRGDVDRSRELAQRARESLAAQQPVRGVLGEGDTRSDEMGVSRRKAARRRLFDACLDELRDAEDRFDPERLFPCVERARAKLPRLS